MRSQNDIKLGAILVKCGPLRTKQDIVNEIHEVLKKVSAEKLNGCDFNDLDSLTKDQMGLVFRWGGLDKELKEIEREEKKMRSKMLRYGVTEVKSDILSLHDDKCDICLLNNKHILIVHHIVPIKEDGGNSLDNFSVLCPNCHAILHKMIGSFNKDVNSEMEGWIKENYSSGAYERLIELFKRYIMRRP